MPADDVYAKEGTLEAAEHGGFTQDFVNSVRTMASVGQGMTLVGTHFWYFPHARTFSQLRDTDIQGYYERAYTQAQRADHATELAKLRRAAMDAKRTMMKGSDALVPHMWIPHQVGYALEKQYPDEFSSSERRPKAMAILEHLMPDWVLVPQYTRRGA